jgi:hypothetical protein
MATSTVAGAASMMVLSLLLAAACLVSVASAESATIYSMPRLQTWAQDSLMTLKISTLDGGSFEPLSLPVLPLTSSLGLNQTQKARGVSLHAAMRPFDSCASCASRPRCAF